MIQSENWKSKKFRRYDIISPVKRVYGGKRHFVNQATDYAKSIWLQMGFKEMSGNIAVTISGTSTTHFFYSQHKPPS